MTDRSRSRQRLKKHPRRQQQEKQQRVGSYECQSTVPTTYMSPMKMYDPTDRGAGTAAVGSTSSSTSNHSRTNNLPRLVSPRKIEQIGREKNKSRSSSTEKISSRSPKLPIHPSSKIKRSDQQRRHQDEFTGIPSSRSYTSNNSSTQCSSVRNRLFDISLVKNQQSSQQSQHWHTSASVMSALTGANQQTTSRTIFHVRLSIGYMTGLTLEDKPPTRSLRGGRSSSSIIASHGGGFSPNHLVLGFVELEDSGKFTALSQPLLPNIMKGGNTTRVIWANPKTSTQATTMTGIGSPHQRIGDGLTSSSSKARRRLHFAVPLEREAVDSRVDQELDGRNDDDLSTGSQIPFVPEVVHLLVGLKCGKETIPLGVAKLVVNGRETMEQKMDLAIQPFQDTLADNINTSKHRRSLFGIRKKNKNYFTNGDHSYLLASNATLRVKADIKAGFAGQAKSEIWGNDDSSFATNWTFDASIIGDGAVTADARDMLAGPDPTTFVGLSGSPDGGYLAGKELPPPPATKDYYHHIDKDSMKDSLVAPDAELNFNKQPKRSIQPPMDFVVVQSRSVLSDGVSKLTDPDPGFDVDWYLSLCGCDTATGIRTTAMKRRACRRRLEKRQHSLEPAMKSVMKSASFDGETSIESNFKPSDYKVEDRNVTAKQYSDLREAQQTLLRYSSKIGVPMEDLLQEMNRRETAEKGKLYNETA